MGMICSKTDTRNGSLGNEFPWDRALAIGSASSKYRSLDLEFNKPALPLEHAALVFRLWN